MTDLLRRARSGDFQAQSEVLRDFSVFIRSCARKFFLSEADREDLRQEGCIALFKAIRHHRAERGPFAPFARVVVRRHINRMAEKMIHVRSAEKIRDDDGDMDDLRAADDSGDPETRVLEAETRGEISMRVREALTTLESSVLALFLQGMSYREVARRLRRPEKSVDNALRRIRAKVSA